jgi:Methyltransferase domain
MNAIDPHPGITCPACHSTVAIPLEEIDLTTQHREYAPGKTTIQERLTTLAGVPGNRYRMQRCQRCGLEYCSPLRAPGNEWYELVYQNLSLYPGKRWEFEFVPSQLATGDTIGEIGCGSGEFLKRCRDAGIPAEGMDFSNDAVEACLAAGLKAKLLALGGVQAAGFAENNHSTIVAFQVLEHLDEPNSLFDLAAAWAASKADLWVAIPSNRRPSRWFGEWDFLDQPPHHMTRWTELALKLTGEQNGWKLNQVFYEPISLLTKAWWLTTRSGFYKSFAASPLGKIGPLEKAVRLALYPLMMVRGAFVGKAISGQTMMAHYTRA